MAIELHHLNTHGMMEQAGKVLDGVVRLKERIAELEKENAELKEAERWRKCSEELPPEGAEVLAYYAGNLQTYFVEKAPLNKFVTYWMPLPKAPKDGK